jgi:hypothetical protein
MLRRIIHTETIWLRHYYAQILSTSDPAGLARVKVACFDLGFNTSDTGLWASPRDKNSLTTLKVKDWVEIYFMNGDRDKCVCLGKATEMQGMLPKNYKKKATDHVLFESPDNSVKIKYDQALKLLEIGNTAFQPAARKTDECTSDTTTDSKFWIFWTAFYGVITGAPIPEPGSGAPSAFQAALIAAIVAGGGTPSKMVSKITQGSNQVKVGNK